MKKANYVLESLRTAGFRLTDSRRAVVELLERQKGPVTAADLVKKYKGDQVVVYRTLELLEKEGLVSVVSIKGDIDRYELAGHHHHHIVCEGCRTIAPLPCGRVEVPKNLPANFSALHSHEVTFYGLCKHCR